MNNRTLWGTPSTETAVTEYEQALNKRAPAQATGQFNAAIAAEQLVEHLARRSAALLSVDVLFAMLALLFLYKGGTTEGATAAAALMRWAFALSIISSLALLSTLGLSWAKDVAQTYSDPSTAYRFSIDVYRRRALRYNTALALTLLCFIFALIAFWLVI